MIMVSISLPLLLLLFTCYVSYLQFKVDGLAITNQTRKLVTGNQIKYFYYNHATLQLLLDTLLILLLQLLSGTLH